MRDCSTACTFQRAHFRSGRCVSSFPFTSISNTKKKEKKKKPKKKKRPKSLLRKNTTHSIIMKIYCFFKDPVSKKIKNLEKIFVAPPLFFTSSLSEVIKGEERGREYTYTGVYCSTYISIYIIYARMYFVL